MDLDPNDARIFITGLNRRLHSRNFLDRYRAIELEVKSILGLKSNDNLPEHLRNGILGTVLSDYYHFDPRKIDFGEKKNPYTFNFWPTIYKINEQKSNLDPNKRYEYIV